MLPLARDAVPTTVAVIPDTETVPLKTMVSGPVAGWTNFKVEVPVVLYVVPLITTVIAPAGSV
ncbi:MAG TPA: hypothetical protein VKR61_22475 [Bryobacteraceae bacterium]|nr:hypothetical protein [Bryobacteraceae bacterium]